MNWLWLPTLIISALIFCLALSTMFMFGVKGESASFNAEIFGFYTGVLSSFIILTANYGFFLNKKIWIKPIWIAVSIVVAYDFLASIALARNQYSDDLSYVYVTVHFLFSLIPIAYTLRFRANKIWR